ncbi:MAG: hypothetical protein HYU88_05095, partial [Chloroflexi bacterium]|nr:hypothetical protein [Chloroflexota bacterium]
TFDALVEQAVATLAVASAIAPQQPMPLADVATEGGAPATAGLPALLPAVEPGLAQLTWAGPRAQPAPASGLDPLALATQAPSATATPAMALPVQVPPSAADGDAVVPAQPQPSPTPAAATGSSPDTAPAQATPRPADAAAPSAPPRPLAPQDALVVSPQPAGATAAGPVSEPSPA